jgi:hypothetical protein
METRSAGYGRVLLTSLQCGHHTAALEYQSLTSYPSNDPPFPLSPEPPYFSCGLPLTIMRHPHLLRGLVTILAAILLTTPVEAQSAAQERAAALRQQLVDVQAQQTELEARLQQLNEYSKAENIEKDLAGVGSTRPEDLREQRRRQFEIERKSVQTRLEQLATSRQRLEAAILQADAAAYHDSARPVGVVVEKEAAPGQPTNAKGGAVSASTNRRRVPRRNSNRARSRRIRRAN